MTEAPGSTPARVTLADVAARAGVSRGAVSQVLNDHPNARISLDARARIAAAVEELGYRPNIVARSLRMAKTATYGFVSDSVTITRFASGILRGALKAAEEAEHMLLIAETGGDPDRERRALESLADRGVDGIVFAAQKSRESTPVRLPPGIACVNVNLSHAEGAIAVLPDEYEGGRTGVRALTDAGHRTGLALIGYDSKHVNAPELALTARRRMDGIFAEMSERGLSFDFEEYCDDWVTEQGYHATVKALQSTDVRALVCLNDRLAFGAYQAVIEAGLSIPHDVSVVSFDDEEIAAVLRPGLTSVGIPHERMGELAVALLPTAKSLTEDIFLPMELAPRGSIAAPRD